MPFANTPIGDTFTYDELNRTEYNVINGRYKRIDRLLFIIYYLLLFIIIYYYLLLFYILLHCNTLPLI